MSTCSTARNLFPPLDNPELTIQKRSRADPTLLNDFEMATEGNDDPPVLDLRTIEELCQLSLNGRGGPIALIVIQATNFGLKNDMIQQMANMFLGKYFPPSMVTKLRNKITNFRQRPDESLFEAWERYKLSIDQLHEHSIVYKKSFPPLKDPERTIRRRTHVNPSLLNDFKEINMAANGNGDNQPPHEGGGLPVLDLRTMEEFIKVNGVTDDAFRLYLFPHSLTHHTTAWFDRLPRNSITTFEQMAKMFLEKYFPPSMVTKLRNEITNFRQCPDESLFEAWKRYKHSIDRCPNHNMLPDTQIDTFYNGLTLRHRDTINVVTGGTFMKRRPEECYDLIKNITTHHNYWDTSAQTTPVGQLRTYMLREPIIKVMNTASSSGSRTLPSNTITNPKEDLKDITTRSETAYQGPTIPIISCSLPQVVERETEATKDTVHPTNNGRTKDIQPLVVQIETHVPDSKPVVAPIIEPIAAPVSALKPNQKPSISDPDKFLIPCDFSGMDECLALVDLGASINLMPLSVWNKLSLPELSLTCMTLELVDRLIPHSVGVAEDVFVKVGTFHFSADFVVVDFDADPRVSLILEGSFLKTGRALIDVFKG
uniref:Reverse transcriptase domain-containing protein n=1 Tax=Tanacetum cinerariifolium TaxID=118510 RepID=A0A699IGC7_TANCI|nr:reverse transcriptase domain-containing protein [Tanacetum cinerariifolium]